MRKWRAPRDNDGNDNDADEDVDDDDADGDGVVDNGDDEDDVHDAPFRPFFLPSFLLSSSYGDSRSSRNLISQHLGDSTFTVT